MKIIPKLKQFQVSKKELGGREYFNDKGQKCILAHYYTQALKAVYPNINLTRENFSTVILGFEFEGFHSITVTDRIIETFDSDNKNKYRLIEVFRELGVTLIITK